MGALTNEDAEMTTKNDGGPAFPNAQTLNCDRDTGMTLRDYFAAKAVSGMAGDDQPARIASISYAIADAMLLERAK